MSTQTIPAGQQPRIMLSGCKGDLQIEVWDERTFELEVDGRFDGANQAEDGLLLQDVRGDIHLNVPYDTTVTVEHQRGDVQVRGVQALTLSDTRGEAEIEEIADSVRVKDIDG